MKCMQDLIMSKQARALLLAALCAGCPQSKTPSDWPDDPKSSQEAKTMCEAAAATLDALHCSEARPDFATFCEYELDQGTPLHPQCIAKVTSCSDLSKC